MSIAGRAAPPDIAVRQPIRVLFVCTGNLFDCVITLCDDARLVCPTFPGVHETRHWGYDDPSTIEGSDEIRLAAFRRTFGLIGERTAQFATVISSRRL